MIIIVCGAVVTVFGVIFIKGDYRASDEIELGVPMELIVEIEGETVGEFFKLGVRSFEFEILKLHEQHQGFFSWAMPVRHSKSKMIIGFRRFTSANIIKKSRADNLAAVDP